MQNMFAEFAGVLGEHGEWVLAGSGVALAAWFAAILRRVRRVTRRAESLLSRASFEGPDVPRATFLESWRLLEKIVAEAATRTDCAVPAFGSCAAELYRKGVITEVQLRAHDDLHRRAQQMIRGDGTGTSSAETREMVISALDLTREIYRRSLVPPRDVEHVSHAAETRLQPE